VERKNIKEKGKEGRWENQKEIFFSSLTHTYALRTGHTLMCFKKALMIGQSICGSFQK
jgi:hypothetical protein